MATRLGFVNSAPDPASRKSIMARLIESFQESVNTFLDASLIFAASMLGAAVVRHASFIHGTKYTAYGMLGSVFMSAYSIFPAMILQSVADGPKQHWVRHFLWLVVIAFSVTVEVLYRGAFGLRKFLDQHHTDTLEQQSPFNDILWPEQCEKKNIIEGMRIALTVGHLILSINLIWWFYYLVLAAIPARWKEAWNTRPKACRMKLDWRTCFRIVDGLLCLASACFFIALFHKYRKSVLELSGSDKDNDWQFGQVLALATWVPVGVDFFAILFCEFISTLILNTS